MARPKRDPKTGKFVKRNAKRGAKRRASGPAARRKNRGLKGHKPGCKCVIHARRRTAANQGKMRNQRIRGAYPSAGRGVVAELWLDGREMRAWSAKNYDSRNRILRHANNLSKRHGRKTVVIKSPTGRELERWRAI